MIATDAVAAAAVWRPQLFGDKRARSIADPIIEPLWTGPRILALVDRGDVTMSDIDGDRVDGHDAIAAELRSAAGGATLIVEAALSSEPLQAVADIASRDRMPVPEPGKMLTQMVVGSRGERKARLAAREEEARRRTLAGVDDEVALVAIDLIWLDDESLCEVPLLERRRVLESVLTESRLIRVGVGVRPPVDPWLGSWRAFGFRRIAFKAANSRYVPGAKNDDWAVAEIPPA